MNDTIPQNERPAWDRAADQPPSQFEPLGQEETAKTAPQPAQGWQTPDPQPTAPAKPKKKRKKHQHGWHHGKMMWLAVLGFFAIKDGWFGIDFAINPQVEGWLSSYWWTIFLWFPFVGWIANAFNIEKRVFTGIALIMLAAVLMFPGEITSAAWLGLGLVSVGLVSLFARR